jgi:hypothetical protein
MTDMHKQKDHIMKASTIKFGIEIECTVPTSRVEAFRPGAYHRGIQIIGAPEGWNAQRDASLRAPAGHVAVEVVSPILEGEDGLTQVVYMLDYLGSIGARVNVSCGLHVHVDARGLDNETVNRAINTFRTFEMAFYGLNGSAINRRLSSPYCVPFERVERGERAGRYQSLNLANLEPARKGTLEVRCFAASLDPATVVAAIYMAVALVAIASEQSVNSEFANHAARITNPLTAMRGYTNLIFADPAFQIMPEAETEALTDIFTTMVTMAERAAQAMGPRSAVA